MDQPIPELDVEIPEIDQIAIVVEDLQDGMDRYRAILGVEPWTVYRFEPPELQDTTYRGEQVEYGMLLALGYAGDTMLELIEPTIGPNLYTEHLDQHGEGLHHFAYFGWSEEETHNVITSFEAAGMPVIQSGKYVGSEFWYFDTADELNGVIFETAVRGNVEERSPVAVYPDDPYPPDNQ